MYVEFITGMHVTANMQVFFLFFLPLGNVSLVFPYSSSSLGVIRRGEG
jgi:hypothetical protein